MAFLPMQQFMRGYELSGVKHMRGFVNGERRFSCCMKSNGGALKVWIGRQGGRRSVPSSLSSEVLMLKGLLPMLTSKLPLKD